MISITSSFDGRPDGVGELTRWAASLPDIGAAARRSAIGSVGYHLKSTLKDTVNSNPAGWPRLSVATPVIAASPPRTDGRHYTGPRMTRGQWDAQRAQMRESALFSQQFARMRFWGVLANLAVYVRNADGAYVDFGFQAGTFGFKTRRWTNSAGEKRQRREANVIGSTITEMARLLTEGSVAYGGGQTVDRSTQNYLRAIGLFSPRLGTVIHIPPRPLIGPHVQRMAPELPRVFAEKFWASFARKASPEQAWIAQQGEDALAREAA